MGCDVSLAGLRWQARRNLSDHARLLAALPPEDSDAADTAEQEYQHHQQHHQHQEYSHSANGFPPGEGEAAGGVVAWEGQDGRAGEAEEDGMAIDDGEVRACCSRG